MPLFAVGAAMGLMTAWLERTHVGASGADWGLGFVYRVLVAGRALCFYAWKLLWPVNLSFNYERGCRRWNMVAVSLPARRRSLFCIALWMAHGRIGRGPVAAALFFARFPFPGPGLLQCFSLPLFLCGRPFSISRLHRPHNLVRLGLGPAMFWSVTRERLRLFTAAAVLVVSSCSKDMEPGEYVC